MNLYDELVGKIPAPTQRGRVVQTLGEDPASLSLDGRRQYGLMQRARIGKLVEEGADFAEIVRATGIDKHRVRRLLREMGL